MFWQALPLALAAAISPWTLLITTHLLAGQRPVQRTLVFLAAAVSISLAVGYGVVVVLSQNGLDDPKQHHAVSAGLDVAVGAVLVLFGVLVARRPPRQHDKEVRRRREMGLLGVVALGLYAGSPSPFYLASLHTLAKGRPSAGAIALDVLILGVLVLLFAEIPILMYLRYPQTTGARLQAANRWLAAHARIIVIILAIGAGVYFVVDGIVELA